MNNWRSKPRTGRSIFIKHINEIKIRIEKGETNRQIFSHLSHDVEFSLSESQFNRYVRKYLHETVSSIRYSSIDSIEKSKKDVCVFFNESENETIKNKNEEIDYSEWNNIDVNTPRLIKDLNDNGFSPETVKSWDLPNDAARRKKLTQLITKKG